MPNWETLRVLLAARNRFDRLVTQPADWAPAVDVYETTDRYIVVAELPGLGPGDVELSVEGRELTLGGERREPPLSAGEFHRIERGYGRFTRTFAFAHPIEPEGVAAGFRDGLLTITVPKASNQPSRRINVD